MPARKKARKVDSDSEDESVESSDEVVASESEDDQKDDEEEVESEEERLVKKKKPKMGSAKTDDKENKEPVNSQKKSSQKSEKSQKSNSQEKRSSQKSKDQSDDEKDEEEAEVRPSPQPQPSQREERSEPKGPKSRLLITHMTLENFKSYAGEISIGPFHKCFSSVVGPNGSGKSNVIDALLFVFGKRANKLRHKSVKELIHHSDKYPKLDFCKVCVYFVDIIDKDDDEFDVIPGSEMVISRIGRKNNSSDYYMNDKKVSFKEIGSLLKAKGIDLDYNRFLILQGEVEQIALMKPKGSGTEEGLLEYLEDIIGTNVYVADIEGKAKALEEANETRGEKVDRLKLVEKDKGNLESSKVEAEEYLNLERQIIDQRSILYQLFRSQADGELEAVEKKKSQVETKLKEEREKVSDSTEKLAEYDVELKKGRKEVQRIEKEMLQAKSEFAVYERRDIKNQEDLKHFNAKQKKLEAAVQAERKKMNSKTASLDNNQEDIQKLEKEIEKNTKQLEKEEKLLDEIYGSLRQETADFQVQLEEKQKEQMPWDRKKTEQQSALDLTRSELQIAKTRFEDAREKLAGIQKALKQLKDETPKKKKRIDEYRNAHAASQSALENARIEFEKICKEEEKLSESVKTLRVRVEEAKASVHNATSGSALIKGLMDAKKKKKLAGIYGRLGDLGTISEKYDVAISTACTALNHIVVDTTSNAEKCVQYLRTNRLGIATFIILEKLEYLSRDISKEFQAPEKSERLFDLINIKDPIFANAFYFALRDTLVCKDLDIATKIAYGATRYRIVTLEGNLIDISGTMSGGGNRIAKGGMSASFQSDISAEELEEMGLQLESQSQRLAEVRRKKTELEVQVENLSSSIRGMEVDISKLEMDVKGAKTQQKELESRIPELEEAGVLSEDEEARIKELEAKFEEQEAKLKKTCKTCHKFEKEVEVLHNQINEIGGVRLKVQKSKVESLTNQLDTASSSITKAQVAIETTKKAISKSEKLIEETEREVEETKAALKKCQEERHTSEEDAVKVFQSYQETQTLLDEKTNEIKSIQKKFDKCKKVVDLFRTLEVDLQNTIEDHARVIQDSLGKAQGWSKKITDLHKQKARTKIEETDEDENLPVLSVDELGKYDASELQNELAKLEEHMSRMKPNMNAIREYRKKEKEYQDRAKELDDATEARDTIRRQYEDLRKKRLYEFMAGFSEITLRLKEMYQMITMGGDAELELVDSLDPFSEGIVFSVRPPKKSWKNISNLSGGEKTLSSLALVFALHHYKPTPLYVMDEIDAALDFKNVSIVANYIKERTKNAQFIIISLRNYMFELADHLVGIYKTSDCSRSVTINPSTFAIPNGNGEEKPKSQKSQQPNVQSSSEGLVA